MSSAPSAPSKATVSAQQNLPPREQTRDAILINPIPLTFAQESQVRDIFYKRVRTKCADEIRDFAACAKNRTFSATWACRDFRLAMNKCMIHYDTQAERDAAREEWFSKADERRLAREAKEKKKREQEKFHREWWDLPPRPEDVDDTRKEK